MTFYQELQLSSTGSKQLIRSTTDPKEKRRHFLIYNFKVYLVMAFCVAVVSMYSKLTGSSPCVVLIPKSACRSTSTASRTVTPTTLLLLPVSLLYMLTTATQKAITRYTLKL